jgi:hypothetical protein
VNFMLDSPSAAVASKDDKFADTLVVFSGNRGIILYPIREQRTFRTRPFHLGDEFPLSPSISQPEPWAEAPARES